MSELEVTPAADAAPVADAGGADSASSTEIDYATQSDDDILDGVTAEKEPASQDPAVTAPAGEEKPVPVAEPEKVEPKDEEEADEAEPESMARLYGKNPEIKAALQGVFDKHPEVRAEWFKAAQIRDLFPTIAEARELRSTFPTVEMARRASSAVSILSQMDQEVTDAPEKFAGRLAQANLGNFTRLIDSSRKVLYEKDPKAYASTIGDPVTSEVYENLTRMASESGDEPLQAALAIIADRTGIGQKAAKPTGPVDPRIAKYDELEGRAKQIRTDTQNAFSSSVDQAYWDGLDEAIATAVGKPETMSAKALERVKAEVRDEINRQVSLRQDLQPQYEHIKRNGNFSPEHKSNAANFLLAFAKQMVGSTARKAISEWTRDVIQQNQATLAKVDAKPKHKDVGAGSGKGASSAPRSGKIDYSKTSDDDILSEAFAR